MKLPASKKGFTLIELLVVIAVIALLATIAIVSYTGVRDRAKTERSAANTLAVRKVAEAYYSRHHEYPSRAEHFTSTHTTLPSDIILLRVGQSYTSDGQGTVIDPKELESTITYKYTTGILSGVNTVSGACMYHWDFTTNSRSEPIYIGNANPSNCHYSISLGSGLPAD